MVEDVPYNGDPGLVHLLPQVAESVRLLRRHRLRLGVVTNQSGIGRGLLTEEQVALVNRRIDVLLGGLDVWFVCPHVPEDGCGCRKPAPGLVEAGASALGLHPAEVVVIGDIAADVEAAEAAGATGVLVPTDRTRPQEVAAARFVAPTIRAAVDRVLQGSLR